MSNDSKHKVVLITGGTSGIGLATARLFATRGATVYVTGNGENSVKAASGILGKQAIVLKSDAGSFDDTTNLIERIIKEAGKLDVLFLNAGVFRVTPAVDMDPQDFEHVIRTNLMGPWYALRAAGSHLQKGASVIVTTSLANQSASPGTAAYAASKAGLRALVRVVAAELAPKGIRINAVSPGPIATPVHDKLGLPEPVVEKIKQDIASRIPTGRLGTPEEVAKAVLFLASDDASFITGTELTIDGGMGHL